MGPHPCSVAERPSFFKPPIPMEACKLSSTQMRPTHAAIAEIGQSVKLNNKIVFGGLFLVIAVSCATFGLTLGAVELAKEAKVSDTGVLTSMTGQPVKVQCGNGVDKVVCTGGEDDDPRCPAKS